VLGRKKSTLTQVRDVGGDLVDGSTDRAKKALKRSPGKVDAYAAGAVLVGMGNWISMSLFNFDAVKAAAGRKAVPGRAAYGVMGLAALYATMRGARGAAR
jgi:uncharacterized membrane protein YuzA (DUF378 family)